MVLIIGVLTVLILKLRKIIPEVKDTETKLYLRQNNALHVISLF